MQPTSLHGTGLMFLDFAMCARSALTTYLMPMPLPAALCVLTSATRASELGWMESAAAQPGVSSSDSFVSFDPVTLSWRTLQRSFIEDLDVFSATWPRSGTMQNGQCYPRAPWVRHTHGSGCSLWPTPVKSLALSGGSAKEAERALSGVRRRSGHRITLRLTDLVKHRDGGLINPRWAEWLMGFPADWTAWDTSETQ